MCYKVVFAYFSLLMFDCAGQETINIQPFPTATVTEGESLTFTCTYRNNTFPSGEVFLWFLNGKQALLLNWRYSSCIYAEGNLPLNYTCGIAQDISGITLTLTLTQVQRSQHGDVWGCRIKTMQKNSTIVVNVPITNVDVTRPNTSLVTVTENSPSTFVCETSAGRPQATIQWYKQLGTIMVTLQSGANIAITSQSIVNTTNSLQLTPTRRDHNYKVFCTAYNIDDSSKYTSNNKPQLYVQYAPDTGPILEGQTNGNTFYILDGKPQKLTCSIEGGRPLASLSLNCFNGVVQDQSIGNTTTMKVEWTSARAHDGEQCTCQSSHPDAASNREVYVTIESLYPPASPTFTVRNLSVSSTFFVIEGADVSVKCSSTSNPSPMYSWNPTGLSPNSEVLQLTSVSTNKNGLYTCTVTNTMVPTQGAPDSGSSSASINLNVLFPPRTPVLRYSKTDGPIISSAFNVVRGDSFSIYCNADGNPSPSYQWSGQSANSNKLTVTGIQTDTSCTCIATNEMVPTGAAKQTGSSTTAVTANVLYGPSTPKLTYQNSSRGPVSLENGFLNMMKGKSFIVTCDGSDSKPMSEYNWSGAFTSSAGTLSVYNLQSRTSVTCTARNVMNRTYGITETKLNTQAMTIDVLYPPTVTYLTNETAVENETFSKDCLVTTGNPVATNVTWTRVEENTIVNGHTLTIGKVTRGSAGAYRCTAKNKMQPTGESAEDGTDSATFILDVYYSASIIEFTINGAKGAGPFTYIENTTVTIVCVVDSNPESAITIYRDSSVKETAAITKEITHTVNEASCLDAGIYSCTAGNQYNDISNSTILRHVFITCPPRPLDSMNNYTYYYALNESVTLNLTVTAYPEPTFGWYKQGVEMTTGVSQITVGVSKNSHQTNLTLKPITEVDLGQYKVVVTNDHGTFDHLFFVAAQDIPQIPTNVTIELVVHNSAVIQWVPGFNGGLDQTFFIKYWPSSQNGLTTLQQKSDTRDSTLNITLTNLTSETEYTVQVYAGNSKGNSTMSIQATFITKKNVNNEEHTSLTAAAAGGGIAGAVVTLAVGVLVFLMIRRRKNSTSSKKSEADIYVNTMIDRSGGYTMDTRSVENTMDDSSFEITMIDRSDRSRIDKPMPVDVGTYTTERKEQEIAIVIEPPKRTQSAILLRELEKVAFSHDSAAAERFSEEFQKFREGMTKEHNAALQNRSRNKYRNLYAYDETRVVLDIWDDDNDTDYINACYIQGFKKPNAYIASQGPIKNNLNDFWRMVWQTNAVQIVMLTNIIEHGKEKCIRYWPEDGSEIYGRITVTLAARETFSSFVIRTFMVNKDVNDRNRVITEERIQDFEPPRQVQQFHFTAWPDKDVPAFCSALVHFRSKVKAAASACDGPVVVHCSAGIGRTGTYIAIDYLVDEAEELEYVDVVGCVTALREQRVNMVQKEKQYVFVHLSLVEILLLETSVVSTSDFVESYKHLLKPVNGVRQIDVDFDLLWKLSPKVEELSDNTDATLAEQNVTQDDEYMPSYSEPGTCRYGEVIDAAFLPLYRDDNAMIIATTPTEWTIEKFWNLVYHQQVYSIVMMNQEGVYWPGDNGTFSHGNITISNNGAKKKGSHYIVKLTMFNNGSERDIQLLLFGTWEGDESVPDDPSHVLSALDIVGSNQKKTGNHPIVVHCMDGVERSGLFCVIAALLDRTKIEQDVAISQVIQEIRNRRKNVIPNVEQFEFCHDVVCAFLQQFDSYSNFTFGE